MCNARLAGRAAERIAASDTAASDALRRAGASLALSARSHHRILKVARTIADLAGEDRVAPHHVSEALAYRPERLTA